MQVYFRQESADLRVAAQEAQRAEALGFDGFSSYDLNHDAFIPLAVAAGVTERIKLETRAAVAFPRSPVVTAYMAWDLQDYSQGRLKLGFVAQAKEHVEKRFATAYSPVTPRLREYIQTLRAVWDSWQNGTPTNLQGDYYSVTLMPPAFHPGPFKHGRPPVHLGSSSPNNTRLAGEIADGFQIQTFNSARYIEEVVFPNLEEGARRVGRSRKDLEITSGGTVATGRNKEEMEQARTRARQVVAFYGSYSDNYREVFRVHGWLDKFKQLRQLAREKSVPEFAHEITDEMLETFAIVGEPDEIGPKAKERYGGLVDEVCFTFLRPPLDRKADDELLGRFVRDLKS
ncbi:MAG: TIGR03617 family F420-dependent LLM class oxidoreductase [Chloroflexi bacterium]|nr:TIGR03617 family F420-dependent LLM class oxidoreductase [Chloroflexota bacterium]